MTSGEWILQALLAIGLFLVLPAAVKLERALTAFRRDRTNLEQSAQQLTDAIKDAEVAIMRLRDISRGAGQRMSEQVEHVDAAIRDIDVKTSDLQLMMDRAEALASRLELSIRQKPAQDSGQVNEPVAAEAAAQAPPRPSHAKQPQPHPHPHPHHAALPQSAPAAAPSRDSATPHPASASPTATLAMRRALEMQAGVTAAETPPPRSLAEQRVLHAIRGRTAKP